MDCVKKIVTAAKSANLQRQKYAHVPIEPEARDGRVKKFMLKNLDTPHSDVHQNEMVDALVTIDRRMKDANTAFARLRDLLSERREREQEYLEQ